MLLVQVMITLAVKFNLVDCPMSTDIYFVKRNLNCLSFSYLNYMPEVQNEDGMHMHVCIVR